MTPNKFQHLFLRQYRELHESKSRKRIMLMRMFRSFIGAVIICALMSVILYSIDIEVFKIFLPLGVGLVLGNSASQLGGLMRRTMSWDVVEDITDWPKVYALLREKEHNVESS